MDDKKHHLIQQYFDDFTDAFASFDGQRVAAKFSFPYMAKSAGEDRLVFHTERELGEYFQRYLDEYRQQGCRQCRYSNLTVAWIGSDCAVASVDWTLTDGGGQEIMSWSESYTLLFREGRALAFVSVDHP
ncbi:MAG: hypothetical protein R3175_13985 [Marinobacter sp.]|uniref:hypothetical protein n=1 Tax=Marinobacter sp. TaxID=50741 RepID=UPI00299F012F|nr:hypothetical protein [Marinobacter sp.]MDX1757162.1 hypothetical protein [Marinobacter sp.]